MKGLRPPAGWNRENRGQKTADGKRKPRVEDGFQLSCKIYSNGGYSTIVYANWTANGYRLPTEAEWEEAARGGLSGQRFPWGNSIGCRCVRGL